jgi:hypothetical protein
MKKTNSSYRGKIRAARERSKAIVGAALLGALLLSSAAVAMAQVYGVRRTAVVSGPNRTVVASRTTVVAGGGGLPHGYIAALPGGYRAVYVSGARYYTVGGIYYRPQIYGGRTVYVRVHI